MDNSLCNYNADNFLPLTTFGKTGTRGSSENVNERTKIKWQEVGALFSMALASSVIPFFDPFICKKPGYKTSTVACHQI